MQPKFARHPRKHATHATPASTSSTPFLKLKKERQELVFRCI